MQYLMRMEVLHRESIFLSGFFCFEINVKSFTDRLFEKLFADRIYAELTYYPSFG